MAEWIERFTIVDGESLTGLYAEDGSFNVVHSDPDTLAGIYHPCGAYWITPTPSPHPAVAPNGSMCLDQDAWDAAGGG